MIILIEIIIMHICIEIFLFILKLFNIYRYLAVYTDCSTNKYRVQQFRQTENYTYIEEADSLIFVPNGSPLQ